MWRLVSRELTLVELDDAVLFEVDRPESLVGREVRRDHVDGLREKRPIEIELRVAHRLPVCLSLSLPRLRAISLRPERISSSGI